MGCSCGGGAEEEEDDEEEEEDDAMLSEDSWDWEGGCILRRCIGGRRTTRKGPIERWRRGNASLPVGGISNEVQAKKRWGCSLLL